MGGETDMLSVVRTCLYLFLLLPLARGADLKGSYVITADPAWQVKASIEKAVSRLNLLIKPIARQRLRRVVRLATKIDIKTYPGLLIIRYDQTPPVATPLNGQVINWTTPDNEQVKVTGKLGPEQAEQVFVAKDGNSVYVFRPAANNGMELTLTISSPRLPVPVVVVCAYRRAAP